MMTHKLEERIEEKLEEPTRRVGTFESRNRVQYVNQITVSVVQFYCGPVKFTLGWLDRIDVLISQHDPARNTDEKRYGDKPPPYEAL